MRLNDKICLITGAAQGIGLATAQRFNAEGATLVLCDVDLSALETTVEFSGPGPVTVQVADVSRRDSVQNLFNEIRSQYGRLDVLINNAGITRDASLLKMNEHEFDAVIDVNLKGSFYCAQAAAAMMVEQGSGSIVNASSISGVYGNFGQSNYAAAKAAILGLSKTMARELGPKGIRVNTVIPGVVDTAMTQKLSEETLAGITNACWLKRMARPEEIASAYLFLASDDASYINGAALEVSGGVSF